MYMYKETDLLSLVSLVPIVPEIYLLKKGTAEQTDIAILARVLFRISVLFSY